ncbi:MAG TPA: hypothetical protein VM717_09050 [Chthoniobacterales bacterium]|jgi:hypothetical protein|nr:hypothetical protein [Chthoniobacterales bacterium]
MRGLLTFIAIAGIGAGLRDDKYLVGFGVFHLAARRKAAHVDVAAVGIKWIKNQTRLSRNGFGYRKLRCADGMAKASATVCLLQLAALHGPIPRQGARDLSRPTCFAQASAPVR